MLCCTKVFELLADVDRATRERLDRRRRGPPIPWLRGAGAGPGAGRGRAANGGRGRRRARAAADARQRLPEEFDVTTASETESEAPAPRPKPDVVRRVRHAGTLPHINYWPLRTGSRRRSSYECSRARPRSSPAAGAPSATPSPT